MKPDMYIFSFTVGWHLSQIQQGIVRTAAAKMSASDEMYQGEKGFLVEKITKMRNYILDFSILADMETFPELENLQGRIANEMREMNKLMKDYELGITL